MHAIKNFLGQMTLFEVAKNRLLLNLFIDWLWLSPSGYLGG